MAGTTTMRKIQLGAEVTPGTEVAATAVWRGLGVINDETEVKNAEEHVGLGVGPVRPYIGQYMASVNMPDAEATFEQLPLILSASFDDVAGVQDGVGTGYVYTYPFWTTTKPTVQTYTVEMGNDQQEEQMLFGFVTDFTLSGQSGEGVMLSANWRGRRVQPGTFTGAVSLISVEEILFSNGALYIDDIGGTVGTTAITDTLLSWSFQFTSGIKTFLTTDGGLEFNGIDYTRQSATLEMTFKHNASAVAEIAKFRGTAGQPDPRLIRVQYTGSALGTPSTETNKRLTIDLAGLYETVSPLEDDDDNDVRTFTFKAGYHETPGYMGTVVVVNELSALL